MLVRERPGRLAVPCQIDLGSSSDIFESRGLPGDFNRFGAATSRRGSWGRPGPHSCPVVPIVNGPQRKCQLREAYLLFNATVPVNPWDTAKRPRAARRSALTIQMFKKRRKCRLHRGSRIVVPGACGEREANVLR